MYWKLNVWVGKIWKDVHINFIFQWTFMINIEIREYARKMQTINKQEQYLLDLDKFAGVED